ncbi:MAG: energy-coupling factor transporter transmembrane protein EcfT [Oscillospiraceae bacterium]|nr:energy-coupling factor transporter transmembrane protein EcfT [Oscillospiraceae bacterium]
MVKNEFFKYHPVSNLIYFALGFVSIAFVSNPLVLLVLLFVLVAFNMLLDWGKSLKSKLFFYVLIAAAVFLFNPLFSHRGEMILFYLFGNPMTLESVVYGLKAALSLLLVLLTFCAFNIVINPEKFMYLFSRIAKQTAFVLMLGLRFVPTLGRRLSEIADIAKASKSSPKKKLGGAMNMTLTLISWSLEDAVVTAQSMRARGYGVNTKSQSGKTFYFSYKFTKRDAFFVFFNACTFFLFLFTHMKYGLDFAIYPTFSSLDYMLSPRFFANLFFLIAQFALPVFVEAINNIKWSFLYNASDKFDRIQKL